LDPYLHWDDLGQQVAPAGVSHEVWWAALKLARSPRMQRLPLADGRGRSFTFCVPDSLLASLHHVDLKRDAPGIESGLLRPLAAKALVREAIASARLAGADTPDGRAEELLRAGRRPQDDGERMIANLHQVMQRADAWHGRNLDRDMIVELHRVMLDGLPAPPGAAGRLRRDGEAADRVGADGTVRHISPPAGELADRLGLMCAFANGRSPGSFIHPFVRAAVLHFWVAHDRPFVDGNGRMARTLLRWAMLHQGYSGFGLLAVSAALARAPDRYAESFARAENDDNDLTHFILRQAEAMDAAERALLDDVRRTAEELRQAGRKVRAFAELNPRQQALAAHALRRPEEIYVIAGHQRSHGVTHQTARDDLFGLVRRGLLSVSREGRTYRFRAAGALID